MVKVDDKAIIQYVYFPKSISTEQDTYDLILSSEITQVSYTISGLTDESKTKNYFKFQLDLSQVNDGDYNYSISDLATGLISIGEISDDIPSQTAYNPFADENSENEIVQYYPTGNYKYRFQNNKVVDIHSNGTYNVGPDSGYTALLNVEINADIISHKQSKDVSISENTAITVTCDEGYDALQEVNINVDVPTQDYWNSGYTSGRTDGFNEGFSSGETEQKNKLITTAVTTNGIYSREDGYSSFTVNVSSGSTINNQTKSITATTNGTSAITYDTGYTGLDRVNVTVNVPTQDYWNSGYTSGKTDGVAEQKAKLVSTAVTSNGTYTKTDGYSSVTVNVPTQDYWNSGYTSGYTDGYAAASGGQIDFYTISVTPIATDSSSLANKAQVTFTYGSSSETITYTGTPIIKNVLPGISYIISFNNIIGYTTPGNITGNSTWGGSISYTPTYVSTTPSPYLEQYLTFEFVSAGTFSMKWNKSFDYSFDGGSTWTNTQTGEINRTVNVGDKLMLRGDNSLYYYDSNDRYGGNSKFIVYGNIMSLIDSTGFTTADTISQNLALGYLFKGFSGLISAENLVLPATTLAPYCYASMFVDCTSLTTAPKTLPATTLTERCYGSMFTGCSGLTTAPTLPATNLADSCYAYMFQSCKSLTTAPELPATTLVNSCYAYMFMFDSSLNYVKCLATDISASNCIAEWLNYGSSTGTFVKKAGVTWPTGASGIPNGWTVQEV